MKLEIVLTPSELPALKRRDLGETACVVFDVLRATSTFVTALHNGAKAIIPASEISEALAIHQRQPDVLLGGERDGIRIRAAQTGGIDFDFGNSPREYTAERVRDKTIVSTTTNGTRALRACAGAKTVLASSFLNLTATAKFLEQLSPAHVVFICAGTRENAALEDVLAAGALCEMLSGWGKRTREPNSDSLSGSRVRSPHQNAVCGFSDSAGIALRTYLQAKDDLPATVRTSDNARRLLAITELADDVPFCLQCDRYPIVVKGIEDGMTFVSVPENRRLNL